jgi:hypothetical protein|tara:strand:+ start:99 stop:362 length:264 start_codon:yes stop_codon:yes gene_type:complete
MLKELKYLLFLIFIIIFFFLTFNYYFSDNNKKKSHRSKKSINLKIEKFSKKLILLRSDTKNITYYVEKNNNKNKKSFNFWKLINDNK